MKKLNLLCVFVVFAMFISSCGGDTSTQSADSGTKIETHGQAGVIDTDSDMNILQIAAGSDAHTTLAAACKAADMLDVLANAGPLTVFAPTNAAFEKLPEGTVEELLKPENKETLAGIIQFHASPGTFKGKSLKDGMKLYMASGHYVDVEQNDEGTFVNGSKIVATIDASNGVVHVVEDVFLPPEAE